MADERDTTGEPTPPDDPEAGSPHDDESSEPLGPMTPDAHTPLGDTPEVHDEISPHDLPKGHPGRAEAERQAGESADGTTRGNQ
jgi:hypothetical protein